MKKKLPYSFNVEKSLFPFIFILAIYGCNDQSVSDNTLNWYEQRSSGSYPFSNEHVIVINNFIGPVIVNGEISGNPSIRWFLDKKAEAGSEEKADEMFPLMLSEIRKSNDTIYVTVNSSLLLHIDAGIELDIPNSLVCIIEKVKGNSQINYMDTLVTVKKGSNVIVGNHKGSCEISSEAGNISVELALPKNGFCRLKLNSGNIIITLPAASSATVYAKSNSGSVSQTGLTFRDILQSASFLSGTLGEGTGEINAEVNAGTILLKAF